MEFGGQVVSIGLLCSDFRSDGPATPLLDTCVFLSEGDSTATFLLSEGDCGGNVCNDVVNFHKAYRRTKIQGGPNNKQLKSHLTLGPR